MVKRTFPRWRRANSANRHGIAPSPISDPKIPERPLPPIANPSALRNSSPFRSQPSGTEANQGQPETAGSLFKPKQACKRTGAAVPFWRRTSDPHPPARSLRTRCGSAVPFPKT
ncbi:hypothetical protein BCR34DRAFT_358476 [Clohesyomyces aquaticus]|uniref:Uncharacterized protein n=1 Tax=Clohesyomyces aquaticus TaxID=1231657 RepID=A0A1Y1ZIA2_9PLEO|nr:hypothetical protein BCR34DRAFT_358476 [Clohesyomyces aquaticus]